ncbi:hypothetical protein DM02DRAFT_19244 [Periconia macrospinosa]|uniref:Ubiquitin 3 binding protein But2 C-terminal domain-containing protein n=1 Tax=Periconia macrospinosa TaxID=97972 RepID=A0A2V1DM67_9PLEO|nr:hypothetical protein DM02DRAFT_19244 [Periconia macrospinosa]
MQLLTTLALLSASASALPASTSSSPDLSSFYLVTSNQSTPASNSSLLPGVSATTPYNPNPLQSSPILLRLLAPGYNSLPTFSLNTTSSVLSTTLTFHNVPTTYSSSTVKSGEELQFVDTPVEGAAEGGFGVSEDGLLTVGKESKGWMVCTSQRGERTIWFGEGGSGEGCVSTWVHVVAEPPYLRKRG